MLIHPIENLSSSTVLVTGGTSGLGKAVGLAYAKAGATVFLTYRWGNTETDEVIAEFEAQSPVPPRIVEADVSDPVATRHLLQTIHSQTGRLDVFVSNVAFAKIVDELNDLKLRALEHSLRYSTWPLVDYVQAAVEVFGKPPRYVIAISSDGGQVCHPGYDMVGITKASLETLCRYLAVRLKPYGTRVNAIRPGFLDTASSRATFGAAAIAALRQALPEDVLDIDEVAKTCIALTSGYMDAVTGQVLVVDDGQSLVSPLAQVMMHANNS